MATEFRSIEDAVRGIEKSTYEIQTESRLVYSGLKQEQNIAAVLEKYAWLYNPETVRRVEETYRAETGSGEQRAAAPGLLLLARGLYRAADRSPGRRSSPSRRTLP